MSSPKNNRRASRKPIKARLVFDPQSFDSQFSRLNATAEAVSEKLKTGTEAMTERIETTANALTEKIEVYNSVLTGRLDQQDRLLLEIKSQTTATNGRVTILEKKHERHAGWIAGAAAIGSLVVTVGANFLWHVFRP